MNNLSRATLAAGAIKLGGFAAFNAEAGIAAGASIPAGVPEPGSLARKRRALKMAA